MSHHPHRPLSFRAAKKLKHHNIAPTLITTIITAATFHQCHTGLVYFSSFTTVSPATESAFTLSNATYLALHIAAESLSRSVSSELSRVFSVRQWSAFTTFPSVSTVKTVESLTLVASFFTLSTIRSTNLSRHTVSVLAAAEESLFTATVTVSEATVLLSAEQPIAPSTASPKASNATSSTAFT